MRSRRASWPHTTLHYNSTARVACCRTPVVSLPALRRPSPMCWLCCVRLSLTALRLPAATLLLLKNTAPATRRPKSLTLNLVLRAAAEVGGALPAHADQAHGDAHGSQLAVALLGLLDHKAAQEQVGCESGERLCVRLVGARGDRCIGDPLGLARLPTAECRSSNTVERLPASPTRMPCLPCCCSCMHQRPPTSIHPAQRKHHRCWCRLLSAAALRPANDSQQPSLVVAAAQAAVAGDDDQGHRLDGALGHQGAVHVLNAQALVHAVQHLGRDGARRSVRRVRREGLGDRRVGATGRAMPASSGGWASLLAAIYRVCLPTSDCRRAALELATSAALGNTLPAACCCTPPIQLPCPILPCPMQLKFKLQAHPHLHRPCSTRQAAIHLLCC